jgi:hypothetical protein
VNLRFLNLRFLNSRLSEIGPIAPEALDPPTVLRLIRELADAAIHKHHTGETPDRKQDAEIIEFFDELAKLARQVRRSVGRPQRKDVTDALKLEAAGESRKEIYRRLGKQTQAEQHALREAMRTRKNRAKRPANK